MQLEPGGRERPPDYRAYLSSDWWRRRRLRSLRLSGYRCQRCGSKRELQVHHLRYERLGAERDEDLEVRCGGCHEDAHPGEAVHSYLRLYLRIARQILEAGEGLDSAPDLMEVLKTRCARLRVPYSGERLGRALELTLRAIGSRPRAVQEFIERRYDEPPSASEAREILRGLGATAALKTMPTCPNTTTEPVALLVSGVLVRDQLGRVDATGRGREVRRAWLEAQLTERRRAEG